MAAKKTGAKKSAAKKTTQRGQATKKTTRQPREQVQSSTETSVTGRTQDADPVAPSNVVQPEDQER